MRKLLPVLTVLAPLLLLSLLALPACSPSDGFESGRPISREELESISDALFSGTEDPSDTAPTYTDREPNVYYRTKSGRVYHKYRDCIYLKNSKEIESGGLISAEAAGKESPCSSCCGD